MKANLKFYGSDGNLFQNFDFVLQLNARTNLREKDMFGMPSVPTGKLKFALDVDKYEFYVNLPMMKFIRVGESKVSTTGYPNEQTLTWELSGNKQLIINFKRFDPDPAVDYVEDKLCVYLFKSITIVDS